MPDDNVVDTIRQQLGHVSPMGADSDSARLVVEPSQPAWKKCADLGRRVFEVPAVVEGVPPRVDEPPSVRQINPLRVGLDLEQSVLVRVTAWHFRVVGNRAVRLVFVPRAVAGIVVEDLKAAGTVSERAVTGSGRLRKGSDALR